MVTIAVPSSRNQLPPLLLAAGQTAADPTHMPSKTRILASQSVRFLYRRLPLPPSVKWHIKSFLYRHLGPLLHGSANYQQWLIQTAATRPATVKTSDPASPPPLPAPPMVEIDPEGIEGLAARLAFAAPEEPLVSIIITAYNHIDYTAYCLASIHRHSPEASCELIVVDDASSDATERLLGAIPGLRYFRNAENLGFLRTANHGAAQARGRYLLFLNNDTQVLPGWLDRLLEVFATRPDAGIVGAKLIYPSGHLQEAGAALRRDGTVDLIGLNDDPAKPQYNILREVDHCSKVCLLIETAFFRELGGFDETYAPAYFEDCDLSLRARKRGRKIIYQPAAEVIHHLSVATNQSDRKLRQIERNQQIYLERWNTTLQALDQVRLIAFYLPQYHPIPENDHWWGKGFTEWTNVTKAAPNFVGHYQPRLPADLGFYDLRLPEVREEQSALARRYGIHGFCYYYYWFAGKRLLNRPLDEVVQSGRPNFPFCVCWANENWSRRWDGLDAEILIAQAHSDEDDLSFIKTLEPALRDLRYIRIDGRPLLLVYRPDLLPDAARTAEIWHDYCRKTGLGDLYLIAVQSFGITDDPRGFGFDAAVEFPPHAMAVLAKPPEEMLNPDFRGRFYDYIATAEFFINRPPMPYPFFRTAMPSWDNTARRQNNGEIFLNAIPEHYGRWLKHLAEQTRKFKFGDERMVFVNAWNEWAEGNYLEPDRKFGYQYLEATKAALEPLPQTMAAIDFSHSDANTDVYYLENPGYCPICDKEVIFRSNKRWLRDNYFCASCNTIPRQRALVYFLNLFRPGWKNQFIHESSPSLDYFIKHCPNYTFSHYFKEVAPGSTYNGSRCENLEQMTFQDESFDIFITQDVMEHVLNPDRAFAEIMRVLKRGGAYIFTVPKHKSILNSYPRATLDKGEIIHNFPPDYHGNPIGDGKSLVTWDYGCDFDDLVKKWSEYNLSTLVLRDRNLGIDGEFLEVFIIKKDPVNKIGASSTRMAPEYNV